MLKNTKDIILFLAGKEIEERDKNRSWLPYKYKHLENISKGIMTRRTAISAYNEVRRVLIY